MSPRCPARFGLSVVVGCPAVQEGNIVLELLECMLAWRLAIPSRLFFPQRCWFFYDRKSRGVRGGWSSSNLCFREVAADVGNQLLDHREEIMCWAELPAPTSAIKSLSEVTRIVQDTIQVERAMHGQWGAAFHFMTSISFSQLPSSCYICVDLFFFFLHWRVLSPFRWARILRGPGAGLIFQPHAPVDGWASELALPWESSPDISQNAVVRNKNFSILFWASVSIALGRVLKPESTFVTLPQKWWHSHNVSIWLLCCKVPLWYFLMLTLTMRLHA